MSTPPDTKRARIIRAVAEQLKTIRRVNGFVTDAGTTLSIGAFFFGPDDDLALALIPGTGQKTGSRKLAKKARTLELQVAALTAVADREAAWLRIEAVLGDIKRAIETEDDTLGGLLLGPLDDGEELPLDGEGGKSFGASVIYTATYVETWGAP